MPAFSSLFPSLRPDSTSRRMISRIALVLTPLLLAPCSPAMAGGMPAIQAVDASAIVARAMPAVTIVEPLLDDGTPAGGHGSGFLFDRDGHILTNAHVVGKTTRVRIKFKDGRIADGIVRGRDARVDLAVIRIEPPSDIVPLVFADTSPQPGAAVIALGSPMSFPFSASAGIVSGDTRAYDTTWPVDFLQHDAALNQGSSGGPLVDSTGRVVGVNSATPPEAIFDIGIGLAIPAAVSRTTAEALIVNGRIERGALGVMASSADAAIAQGLGVACSGGLLIDMVSAGSAAARAGLAPGDIVTAIDGTPLTQPRDLSRALLASRPGQRVRLAVARHAGATVLTAMLDTDDPDAGARTAVARATIVAAPPAADLGLRFASGGSRAVINAVADNSIADLHGLRAGDVVLAIANQPVATGDAARAALAAQQGALAVLRVERPGIGVRHMALPRTAASAKLRAPGVAAESSAGPL